MLQWRECVARNQGAWRRHFRFYYALLISLWRVSNIRLHILVNVLKHGMGVLLSRLLSIVWIFNTKQNPLRTVSGIRASLLLSSLSDIHLGLPQTQPVGHAWKRPAMICHTQKSMPKGSMSARFENFPLVNRTVDICWESVRRKRAL